MTRSESREQAFILNFEAQFSDASIDEIIELASEMREFKVSAFASKLIHFTQENCDEINNIIASFAKKWDMKRISKVSLAVLQLAVGEIMQFDDIPVSVTINEAVELCKKYGGDVGPQEDLEAAHEVLKNELQLLHERLSGLVFDRFFGDNDLARLQFIQEAAEYILANSVERKGEVSFLKLFKEHVKRLRSAYNICNPAGILTDEEIAWSQCFMGVCSYVNKMTATEHDTESMNRHVEQMVQEAILASGVERVMNDGVEENIFSDSFTKEVDGIKMPFTKFQILCKLVAKAIRAYGRTNKIQAEHFQKMLEETIDAYNTRDKLTFTNDVTQNVVNDVYDIVSYKINGLSNKLLDILKELKTDSEKFKVLGITFEEKAFFDVLVEVRDKHGFEYADDRCIELAKKIKALIDDTAIYADWLNNDNLKSKLASQLTFLLYKEGYPPQWDEEVFQKVLEQVENYKKYE